jgi:16S rRNA (uracil1498-N3)-methyltransferase
LSDVIVKLCREIQNRASLWRGYTKNSKEFYVTANPPRLYVDAPLNAGALLEATVEQTHYLNHVLRLKEGDSVRLFNGHDGEWQAALASIKKKSCTLKIEKQLISQTKPEDIFYLFAPIKHARLDYMAQKATEMGASRLMPVLTQNTQVTRVNIERLRANAIEAAEQCNLLNVPDVCAPLTLDETLANWHAERVLVFCDESANNESPLKKLTNLRSKPYAVLVGPEGGFSKIERDKLLGASFTLPISLGPRILRADTAAVAALAMLWLARA